jgi:hypothetical protein
MANKHIYIWYDGDVKRHYFSSKQTFNKWVGEFADEVVSSKDYYDPQIKKLKTKQDIKKYFSSGYFLEKIELDI